MSGIKREAWSEQRIFLTAFGEVEQPADLTSKPIVTRSAERNCKMVLSRDGQLVIDTIDEKGKPSEIQLTREQHAELLAAFTSRSSDTIREKTWTRRPQRTKETNQ